MTLAHDHMDFSDISAGCRYGVGSLVDIVLSTVPLMGSMHVTRQGEGREWVDRRVLEDPSVPTVGDHVDPQSLEAGCAVEWEWGSLLL